jgi:hypothetical protein
VVELDHISALHAKLQNVNSDPGWYSNPCNKDTLPFPFLYTRLPQDRFALSSSSSTFEFMGRERFSDVWKEINAMVQGIGFPQLYIHGTMGYGKSHILAALACLLARTGRPTVYIPDCRQAAADPLPYIQSALLCTFTGPLWSARRDLIRSLMSTDDVLNFCRGLAKTNRLYFIVDQINALESEAPEKDQLTNAQKEALRKLLSQLYIGHYSVTSSSANYRTAMHMHQKQTGETKIEMMGGFSEVRMAHSSPISFSCCPIVGRNESLVGPPPVSPAARG